jgi:hypothetical protein
LRTFDDKNGYKIIDSVYENEPGGIRDRQLRFHTHLNTRTFDKWKRRLIELSILEKDEDGYYHLTQRSLVQYENNALCIPPDKRKKKNRRIAVRKSSLEERRTNAYMILITLAANGNYQYKESKNQLVPIPRVGVGISDFVTKERSLIQTSELDERILLGYNERFAYLNLGEQEFTQYINELKNHNNNPILRELTIDDYEFLSYVYVFDKPDLLTLELDGAFQTDNTKRIQINNDETEDKLLLIHDIYYDDIKDVINSKIVLNVNIPRTRRTLGLDVYYEDGFSIHMFDENRYVVADPLLKEFVLLCNQVLELVWWRMEYVYVNKLLPKMKGVRVTDRNHIQRSYFQWFRLIYGTNSRRTLDNFLRLDSSMIRKANSLKNKEKQQRGIDELSKHYRKSLLEIPQLLREGRTNTQSLVESIDRVIIKNYKRLGGEQFSGTREKYPTLTTSFLEISYPMFMRDIHRLKKRYNPLLVISD